ncbi:MAG TPA: DUF6703 family protein [Nocardioidaceae bacterium]|nr:DUF6703 family protein [Nocardioidaceae bacterium]
MSGPRQRRSGNPAKRASAGSSAHPHQVAPGSLRDRSRGLLVRLAQLPPVTIPAAVLVLMLVGLSAPLVLAVPALLLVTAFVSWLLYLSWPILPTKGRLLRILMVALVLGSTVARITGWL